MNCRPLESIGHTVVGSRCSYKFVLGKAGVVLVNPWSWMASQCSVSRLGFHLLMAYFWMWNLPHRMLLPLTYSQAMGKEDWMHAETWLDDPSNGFWSFQYSPSNFLCKISVPRMRHKYEISTWWCAVVKTLEVWLRPCMSVCLLYRFRFYRQQEEYIMLHSVLALDSEWPVSSFQRWSVLYKLSRGLKKKYCCCPLSDPGGALLANW